MDGLLSDLKILFLDFDLWSCVDRNIDVVFKVCEKIRLFYGLGCEMGEIGELLGRSKSIFVEFSKEVLMSKMDYFCKLNVQKDEVGLFLLSTPEVFAFDLENRVISVSEFLEQLGLGNEELKSVKQKYPHVFGRNRIGNLPNVMRSMGLNEWFFDKMQKGGHSLLGSYAICSPDEVFDQHYADGLRRIRAKRTYVHTIKKLDFLHGIGFGENKYAVKALAQLYANGNELQQRFDCLLRCGIEYSKLCRMVMMAAKILNQQESVIEKKLQFLCTEMGSSLQYLEVFPGYLYFDLEKRIKTRYRLHKWLVEQGFCKRVYSLSTIIATSEKKFVDRISRIHPSAAKYWQENSSKKDDQASFQ